MLDHRQYALKMIANVTYGYTSASFSGRMPCVDIAGPLRSLSLSLRVCVWVLASSQTGRWFQMRLYRAHAKPWSARFA
jgi:hypothetical protein